jgi:transitional endoplasmic reticulum ATPase
LDSFTVSIRIRTVEFQITECEPGEYCSVTPSTEIQTDGEPLARLLSLLRELVSRRME